MAQPNLAGSVQGTNFVGDLVEGNVYHHGSIRITPEMNRTYIEKFGGGLEGLMLTNPGLAQHFGYGGQALVSQGFVFNAGFGLSVNDVSFNAIANLAYSSLYFRAPVFEGDELSAQSEVLGRQFARDGARNGSVQVRTTVQNQRGELVLEYVRLVLVNAEPGKTYDKSDTTQPQPKSIDLAQVTLPNVYHSLPRNLLGPSGKTFEQFTKGETYPGLSQGSIDFGTLDWLLAVTRNNAVAHRTPPLFIVYGGAVKAVAEWQVSGHLPYARYIGMNKGRHIAPTYPSDKVASNFEGGNETGHEQLRSRIKVVDTVTVPDREDLGILVVELTAEKRVTAAGSRALRAANFMGLRDESRSIEGLKLEGSEGPESIVVVDETGMWLRVLDLEQVLAVPTEKAFV